MTGAELCASREALGLSPEQLAEEFICSVAQIKAWEAAANEVACREFPGMLDLAMETVEVLFDEKQEEFDAVMARAKEAVAHFAQPSNTSAGFIALDHGICDHYLFDPCRSNSVPFAIVSDY